MANKMEFPNVRIDPALKEAAERVARNDHCSLTSLIEKVLTDYLRRTGYFPRSSNSHQGLRPQELTAENDD